MTFEVGQRVKVIYASELLGTNGTLDKVGTIVEYESPDREKLEYKVNFKKGHSLWYRATDLELITDESPADTTPAQPAPLLQQRNGDNQVKSPRAVLLSACGEMALKQPHLFLRGVYELWSSATMNKSMKSYIKMEYVGDTEYDTVSVPTFLVFVIAEEQ